MQGCAASLPSHVREADTTSPKGMPSSHYTPGGIDLHNASDGESEVEWPTCHPKSWRSGNNMWFACLRTLEGKLILVWPMEGWFSVNSLSEMRLIGFSPLLFSYICARNKDDIQSNQQRYDTAGEEVMLRSRTQVTLKHQVMELQATFHRIESGNILVSTR